MPEWSLRAAGRLLRKENPNISRRSHDWIGEGDAYAEKDVDTTELIERAQKGDKQAFGALYTEHYSAIYRLARLYLGDAAEDVVGETFLRAWTALPRYRHMGAPFVSWLYGITRHVVTDELRRRKRTEPRYSLPEKGIEKSEDDRLALNAALARLPVEQRKVIEMKYLLGMKNPEVAAILGKSIGAVNAMQWRALQALRDGLEDVR